MAPTSEIVIATLMLAKRNGTEHGHRRVQNPCDGVAEHVRIKSRWMGSGEFNPFTMPIAIGKKHRYAVMMDFGRSPCSPTAPSTTMTIGATARLVPIWEHMIQGGRLFSKVRTSAMSTTRIVPNAPPSAD